MEFRKYASSKFLLDKNVDLEDLEVVKMSRSVRTVNAQALLQNKTIPMVNWDGPFFQTHLTGLACSNGSSPTFLRLHDTFPLSNPEWFTWQGQRLFRIATKSLSPHTVLICNSLSTQMAARINPVFSKFESMVVPCKIMKVDNSYIPCNSCDYCVNSSLLTEFLLAVGTIEPRKNYDLLIDGWESAHKQSRFQKLIILGRPGWKSKNTQKKIKQSETIIWMSPCDFGLQQIFFSASGFISASLAEGFDIPSVFANRLGIPSAISSIDAHKELCPNAQVFFNPNSRVEISAAIKNLKAYRSQPDQGFMSKDWEDKFQNLTERVGLQRRL
jgi:glycosyltransferase involved in cell wall biosynthesis